MAVEVPARVGKGIIKAIKPTGVGVAVPPPQFTAFYLFIHIPISVHQQNQNLRTPPENI